MSDENVAWLSWTRPHFAQNAVPVSLATDLVRWLALGKGDALTGRFLSVYEDVEQMAAQVEAIRKDSLYTLRLRTLKM